jgi:hypothetical protein
MSEIHAVTMNNDKKRIVEPYQKRIAELEAKLHEVCEIYVGMDGWIPKYASEAYAMRIIKQMYEAAK